MDNAPLGWMSKQESLKVLYLDLYSLTFTQPCKSATAVGNAVVNAILCGIYDGKKIAMVRFSMFVDFIFTTYIIVDYFRKIN